MLQSYTYRSRELGYESLQHHVFFLPSKPPHLHFPFRDRVFLGLNLHDHKRARKRNCTLPSVSPFEHSSSVSLISPTRLQNTKGSNSPRFRLQSHSKALVSPTKSSSSYGKKKRYGGSLPSILKSLESDKDLEKTLSSFCERLSPKEQTVILKEQRSWQRVVRAFEFFKSQKDYLPNVIHYNIVLRALGRAQKWDELRLCWIEMAKSGVLPTNNTYAMLVDVYGKAGLVKEALLWIKHMRVRGIFPDEVTMNTVVKVLKDASEFDRADRFYKDWCIGRVDLNDLELDSTTDTESGSSFAPLSFKQFLSTELFRTGVRSPVSKSSDLLDIEISTRKPRLTSTYNTLIDLYGKAGRLKDAADVFAEMLKSGVAIDTITFNTMIFTCGSHGHLLEAESLLSKMEKRGISPDTKTYNIFLSLYARAGNIEAALRYYRKIREVGLFPDIVTNRAVLHALCQRRMVQEVEAVIEEMEKFSMQIDEHALHDLMKMYIDEGKLHQADTLFANFISNCKLSSKTRAAVIDAYAEKGLWAEAEAIFYGKRDLQEQKKEVAEYNVMVKAYGKAKLYDKAFSLFKSMRHYGTWPDECTYNSLIQMFSGSDLADQARDLLSEMQTEGFKPLCLTFSSLIACYVRLGQLSDAVDIYHEMNKAGVKPNEVVYGSLINGFAESGSVEEAIRYFRMMEECGLKANKIVLTSLIKAYGKVGCLEGAKRVYQEMKDLEGGPDVIASNSIIGVYADLGIVSEAKIIFDYLRDKGCADGVSFATMMYLYKSLGMLDEAIDVAEEMRQSGLLRDCASFNKVMACYALNGQLHGCGELLHEMINQKLLPDTVTFKVLFTILKKGGFPIEAVTQLESSYEEGKPYARQAVITSVFSLVGLNSCALESCEAFTKAEVPLDSFAYNTVIYAYGSAGQIDKALNIFMKMQDEGLDPELVTYIHLVDCYGKAGMVEGVKRIYSRMKYGEMEPNESLFKAVIEAFRNVNRQDLADLVNREMRFAFDAQEHSGSEAEDEDEYGNDESSLSS